MQGLCKCTGPQHKLGQAFVTASQHGYQCKGDHAASSQSLVKRLCRMNSCFKAWLMLQPKAAVSSQFSTAAPTRTLTTFYSKRTTQPQTT